MLHGGGPHYILYSQYLAVTLSAPVFYLRRLTRTLSGRTHGSSHRLASHAAARSLRAARIGGGSRHTRDNTLRPESDRYWVRDRVCKHVPAISSAIVGADVHSIHRAASVLALDPTKFAMMGLGAAAALRRKPAATRRRAA